MRAVVCAYGAVGHACLSELIDLGVDVGLVLTHDDAATEKIWFPSVRDLAVSAGVEVHAPLDVNGRSTFEAIAAVAPQYLFSFYFRQMIAVDTLDLASVAALNLHGSLLPRYRGRAPVNWVLLHGEQETGVTLHHMDEKPDHGDIVAQRPVRITREDTALSLTGKLALESRILLREVQASLAQGRAPRTAQDHAAASYFGGRKPSDGLIHWRDPAEAIRNLVRAVTDPWPGAFSFIRGRKLVVWASDTRPGLEQVAAGTLFIDSEGAPLVATGEGSLEILEASWEGEPPQTGKQWARAAEVETGVRFEEAPQGVFGGGGN